MSDYWRDREIENIKKNIKSDREVAKILERKYTETLQEIEQQIDAFYGRYATREGISMTEARKRVTKLDIERYARKAKIYVREKNFTKIANEEMRLYNVTMKINRLELLKKNIELELIGLFSEEERIFYEFLTENAVNEYKRQAGILGFTVQTNARNVKAIVNSSFYNAKWSERLWTDQTALRAELDKLLTRAIIQGKHPKELAKDLRKTFQVSEKDANRLLVTETARVQKDVFMDSLERAKIEQYEYIAEPTACPVCAELDGKIFNAKDAEPGKNIYPMHPYCKCSAAAYVDRNEWDRKLKERGL